MFHKSSCATMVAVSVIVAGLLAAPAPATATEAARHDGLTAATAAASCWEIKQAEPTAASGRYWVITPQLTAPMQVHCDQEHDGGGWVLVGKGREGWKEFYSGQGQPDLLASRPAVVTPADFATVQLPARTIDGLLGGAAVSELSDGLRVRRARDSAGLTWQNVQFALAARDRWSWALSAGHPLSRFRFDSGNWRSEGVSSAFGTNSQYDYVQTTTTAGQDWTAGFAYGNRVSGSTSASSFLWSAGGRGNARPYAELFLRPRLTSETAGWTPIPDQGLAETAVRARASSHAAKGSWGVTGQFNGRQTESDIRVQDFAQLDQTMFVAGNFAKVERFGTSPAVVDQAALAAFDARSGEFLPAFTPTFDNQVKAVEVLPNGLLLAAGDFTVANGAPARGTALLDPVTGDSISSWNLQVANRLSSGFMSVRSLDVLGDDVYIGGSFTHLSGGGAPEVYSRHAARVDWATATPDQGWNPEFNGTVVDLHTTAADDRVYLAGYFTSSQDTAVNRVAALHTAPGAEPVEPAWTPVWSNEPSGTNGGYQQTVLTIGDRVYSGGSQHSLFGFDTATFDRTSTSITTGQGGDFQTLSSDGSVLYGGCHCVSWTYQDAFTWPTLNPGWSQADHIQWIGAWDATTGDYIPDFDPQYLRSEAGDGAWASLVADDGTLWVGGDFTGARTSATTSQTVGGFVRFPMIDHTPPPAPTGVRVTARTADTATLAWTAPAGLTFEVLRDDRVIATTTTATATVPRAGDDRVFVRAVDSSGNRSATTPVLSLGEVPQPPLLTNVILSGSQWSYRHASGAPPAGWSTPGFDASGWAQGRAPLGWGSASIATVLGADLAPSTRPLTVYARQEFVIDDVSAVQSLTIRNIADDGSAVHVNGVEVGRLRLPTGALTHDTYAAAAISTASALTAPHVIEVPLGLLVDGLNTIAVETHANYRSTPNLLVDLAATTATLTAASPPAGEAP